MNLLSQTKFADDKTILLTQQRTLQAIIGISGMLLPLLLYSFLFIDTAYGQTLPSISHYYFTRVSGIFIIVVSALAIFLMIYKGKGRLDFILSTTAGAFALLLLLFPTGNIKESQDAVRYAVTVLNENSFRESFHLISAAIFLLCLACMALFLFTKSDKPKSERGRQKRRRNRVFRVCGVLMIIALAVIFAGFRRWIDARFYSENHLTFWMETIAVESFGFAWLVKAEIILKDRPKMFGMKREGDRRLRSGV
jgi:hypothetical protein